LRFLLVSLLECNSSDIRERGMLSPLVVGHARYSKIAAGTSDRASHRLSDASSIFNVEEKLSTTALSQQSPRLLMLRAMPLAVSMRRYSSLAY